MTVIPTEGTHLIPLGGVGEFGANATIVQTPETCILIDFGIMFPPDRRQPGVDYYVNDIDLLKSQFPNLSALFVTHGHEDHIGGIPHLIPRLNLPIYTMPYTADLIRKAFRHVKGVDPDLHVVSRNKPVVHGDLAVEFIGVTHSIVQACALSIRTLDGSILHTGDFKVDPLPNDGYPFQSDRLAQLQKEGLDLLIMDSTNATSRGFCPSDFEIEPVIEDQIYGAPGRVFFTTFSSHMPRIKRLKQIALRTGRKIAFIGRGFHKHFETSVDIKYMVSHGEVFTTEEAARHLSDDEIIYVVTGSQGEQQSALARISNGNLKDLKFKAGDRMIFSSKTIPGNERQIGILAGSLERDGVEVVTARHSHVHTSGHGYQEDLAYMVALTRPRYVAPIHGEFHQLQSHHSWLQSVVADDQEVLMIEDGDIITLLGGKASWTGKIKTGLVPYDGNQNMPISSTVLRERKDMMYTGLAVICAAIEDTRIKVQVDLNGVVGGKAGALAEDLVATLESITGEPQWTRLDWCGAISGRSKRLFKRHLYGKPLTKIIVDGHIME